MVRGGKFENALDGRVRGGNEGVGEELDPCYLRLVARSQWMLEEGGQLGGKCEGAISVKVIERLLSKTVSSQKKSPRPGIVDGKSPHAIEPGKHALAPFTPGVEKNLGVRVVGCENMPLAEEFAAEFRVIVNFPVKDNGQRPIAGHHGLCAAYKVDDRKAAMPQKHACIGFFKITLRIRPSMRESAGHALQIRAAARADKSGYAAHQTGPVCASQLRVLLTR